MQIQAWTGIDWRCKRGSAGDVIEMSGTRCIRLVEYRAFANLANQSQAARARDLRLDWVQWRILDYDMALMDRYSDVERPAVIGAELGLSETFITGTLAHIGRVIEARSISGLPVYPLPASVAYTVQSDRLRALLRTYER